MTNRFLKNMSLKGIWTCARITGISKGCICCNYNMNVVRCFVGINISDMVGLQNEGYLFEL